MTGQPVELRLVTLVKIAVPLLLGLVVGVVLVKISASSKLMTMVFMAIGLASVVALLYAMRVDLVRLLVFAAFVVVPIPFGLTLLFRDPVPFYVSSNGLNIYLLDLCVIGLLVLRWLQQVTHPGSIKPFYWYWPLLIPALLLLLINVVSACFTPYPFFSFSLVVSNIKMLFVFVVLVNTLQDRNLIKVVVWGMILSLAIEGIVGIEQKLLGVIFTAEHLGRSAYLTMQIGQQIINRVAGTLNHPNAFAMFLNLIIPVAIYFFWDSKSRLTRFAVAIAIVLAVMAEVFSGSRSGWIALMIAMTITVPLWLQHQGKNPVIGMAIALLVGSMVFGLLFTASSSFRDRLLLDDHGTAEVRYPLMDVAENVIIANPFTGVGVNHYTYYMSAYDRTADAIAFTYPYPVHNTFLLIAAETGVPSLLLVISLFAITMILAYKTFSRSDGIVAVVSLGILAAMITLVIHNLGNPSAFYEDEMLWVLMAVIVAVYRLSGKESDKEASHEQS